MIHSTYIQCSVPSGAVETRGAPVPHSTHQSCHLWSIWHRDRSCWFEMPNCCSKLGMRCQVAYPGEYQLWKPQPIHNARHVIEKGHLVTGPPFPPSPGSRAPGCIGPESVLGTRLGVRDYPWDRQMVFGYPEPRCGQLSTLKVLQQAWEKEKG
jgi:hypothetical protein